MVRLTVSASLYTLIHVVSSGGIVIKGPGYELFSTSDKRVSQLSSMFCKDAWRVMFGEKILPCDIGLEAQRAGFVAYRIVSRRQTAGRSKRNIDTTESTKLGQRIRATQKQVCSLHGVVSNMLDIEPAISGMQQGARTFPET